MTATSISLLSILFGIIGANLLGIIIKKYSFGFTGNTIIGVFTSIFVIKSFGRLGFTPNNIVTQQHINYLLLVINLSISLGSAILGLIIAFKVKQRIFI